MKICISSGHGAKVEGAIGLINEVDEARKVVDETAQWLIKNGHSVTVFHDDTSTTQQENLDTIIAFHNETNPDLNVSVHFNANEPTTKPVGTEVWYLTQEELAAAISDAISDASGLIDRGAKYSSGLAFLTRTNAPAVLLEICFVDSEEDVLLYVQNFEGICEAIGAVDMDADVDEEAEPLFKASGTVSWFGGPDDSGVSADEGLAFIYDVETAPWLFLEQQPPGTTGLARRLDPEVFYLACRWDYDQTPKAMLARPQPALVVAKKTGIRRLALPSDWGPHEEETGRAADLSPGLLESLGIETDDEVDVIYPAPVPR